MALKHDEGKAEDQVAPEEKLFGRVYQPGRWDVPNLFLPSLTYIKENPKATAHFRQKVCNRDYDAVRLLLRAGFPPSTPLSPRHHRTALYLAAEMGDEFMCQLLVSFRADPFQRLKPPENGGLITFGEVQKGGRMAEVCADSAGPTSDHALL
ncbi:unnamed protein product [Durusdinium trenchii]|uniref:Uncharacterized protein n=1 Tax=Durusdinium trenchii TaxID=1381693 RepID=A0ABP0RC09_9DINO